METLDQFRRRLSTVSDIKSVVSTMKTLAAARIRQFESVANATGDYFENVELALQVLLQHADRPSTLSDTSESNMPVGLIALGTDQGFCGHFNANVAAMIQAIVAGGGSSGATDSGPTSSNPEVRAKPMPQILCMGNKLAALLENQNLQPDRVFPVPASVAGVNSVVYALLHEVIEWQRSSGVNTIRLVFNRRCRAAEPEVMVDQLMPLKSGYLETLANRSWQSRSIPALAIPWTETFSSVIRQWLFIRVYRSVAESLASENSSRIATMQKAEANIAQRLDELNGEFNRARQQLITDELRDIIAGFEAS